MAIQGKAQVSLAVFGKHPGWDDHIDDLGIETKRLAEVKRVMYSECIAGNIDSGAWEAIDESARLTAFAHEFAWRTPGGLVVGRLWSSKDGKGRSKYPMVVVAQCDNLPSSFIASHVMPALAGMQEKCQAAGSAAEVIQIADETRARLREAMQGPEGMPLEGESFAASPRQLAAMLAGAGMTGDSVGLHRVMYEIDREMAPFRPVGKGDTKKTTRIIDARAQHLRVPMIGASAIDAARFWMGVLSREVDGSVSQMVITPLVSAGEIGFVDLVVGDPAAPQLFCLRAGTKALAPASDVPYTITPDFMARCKATVAGWSGEVVKAPEPVKEAPKAESAPAPVTASQQGKKKGFPWFLPVAAVVVVGGGLAVWRPWEDTKPNIALIDKPAETASNESKPKEPDAAAQEAQRKAKEAADKSAADKAAKDEANRKAEEARKAKEAADKLAADKAATDRKAKDEAARAVQVEKDRDTLLRQFVQLDGLLQQGYVTGEKTSDGQSVDAVFARISASPEFAAFRDATPAARETIARVEALKKIPTSVDATELETFATGAKLAEQMAAWSRLAEGGANWPATPAGLKGAAATVATMETSTNDVGGDRGAMLQKRMLADAAKIWSRYAAAQTTPEALLEAESYLPAFRVKPEQVAPSLRYNIEVARLKRDASGFKGDTPDAALRARLASFVASVGEQKGPGFEGVLAVLNATVSSGVDPTRSGPGSKGWRSEVRDSGNIVAFFPPKGRTNQPIEFARLDVEGVSSYLSTTETSIGMVIDIAESSGLWPEVMEVLPAASRAKEIEAPRGWEWKLTGGTATAIQVSSNINDWSAGWFRSELFKGMTGSKELYPQGSRPPAPTLDTPMQYLTAGAAGTIAGMAGCRLPSVSEWTSAAATDAGGVSNRRDASWKRVWDHSWRMGGAPRLNKDIFDTDAVPSQVTSAVEFDDGAVWFADVSRGAGTFKNLVGNVAEFVTSSPLEPLTGKRDVGRLAGAARVVGASALSPGGVKPMVASEALQRVALGREYSDVGFRLAFTAGAAAKPATITPASATSAVEGLRLIPPRR
ncbi:MAG: hypothetical protein IT432_10405 [Phycisphaerales bacterium]|nr:hypothetical protein [Phycisphaerales bacterium]